MFSKLNFRCQGRYIHTRMCMNTGLYRLVHVQARTYRYIYVHTEHYVNAHTHVFKDSEKLPVCQFLSQCLLKLAEKLFHSSADKRCRGQLCPPRLRDKTSKRDHKIFFIPDFKEEPCNVLTLIPLALFLIITFGTLLLETFSYCLLCMFTTGI